MWLVSFPQSFSPLVIHSHPSSLFWTHWRDYRDGCTTIFELFAPICDMPHSRIITMHCHQLAVNFGWWMHVLSIKTELYYKLCQGSKVTVSLTLHSEYMNIIWLNYCPVCHLLHVTCITSSASYQKIKCVINTNMTG